jgi:hypothetical protein
MKKKLVASWIQQYDIDGIISDNRRFLTKSVYITHQLNVMTGNTTWLTSKLHQSIIKKYTECWVPDAAGQPNLAGELSHSDNLPFYLYNMLSRMHKKQPKKIRFNGYSLGPEPQRGLLESILKSS